jgi:putative ABC transport system substrate-binding protein
VIVVPDGVFYNFRRDVVALVNEAHFAGDLSRARLCRRRALMAYGANVADNFRRAAGYVDKILKGAKPGGLPIQEPVNFDFVVNLKTAQALGLPMPPAILDLANEVIE